MRLGVLGWVVLVALAPYLAACLAGAGMLLLAVVTGVHGARWSGFRQAGLYYIMAGKPPEPRAVPAVLWWVMRVRNERCAPRSRTSAES